MIDLRSDTLTKPGVAMRKAMADADVGDDVYLEDPTVMLLEQRTADLFGHEAGLFCPSGTMSNLLGVWSLVEPGQEVLCDEEAHIVRAELGGHAAMNGITTRTWHSSGTGVVDVDRISDLISPPSKFLVQTAAVAVENTHNFGGGTIQPIERLRELSELCLQHQIGRHLDGARLWNAHVKTGIALAEYGHLFDTISVCYSKGLGAPIGSVLVSDTARIERARRHRKRLGGGWRQAGVLAAAALYALDHNVERLTDDHVAAQMLAAAVKESAPQALETRNIDTNIVVMNTGSQEASAIAQRASEKGVLVSVVGPRVIRAVTHLGVGVDECLTAGALLGKLLQA